MADDDDHFFFSDFSKTEFTHWCDACMGWDGWNTTQVLLFLSEKSAPKIPPQLDEVEEGER
jgi:hypothetical protein